MYHGFKACAMALSGDDSLTTNGFFQARAKEVEAESWNACRQRQVGVIVGFG
jgi:hypothetical protein